MLENNLMEYYSEPMIKDLQQAAASTPSPAAKPSNGASATTGNP